MILTIVGLLGLLVVTGSSMVTWGVQRFRFSSRVLAIAFALTAASWLAFLVAAIVILVKPLVLPSA